MRLLGRVAPDETRSYQVTAPAEGWITKAMPTVVGSFVKKDETLAMFYSPTFITRWPGVSQRAGIPGPMQTNAAERAIQRPGLAEFNVKQYARFAAQPRRQRPPDRRHDPHAPVFSEIIEIVAPADGFITVRGDFARPAVRKRRGAVPRRGPDPGVDPGGCLRARCPAWCSRGAKPAVSLPGRHEGLPARLSDTLPQFDPVSRTLKLRFEADNPEFVFKPDMFVDVRIRRDLPGNPGGAGGGGAGFRPAQDGFCGSRQRLF